MDRRAIVADAVTEEILGDIDLLRAYNLAR